MLFAALRSILGRHFYPEKADTITLLTELFVGTIFHFPYAYARSIIGLLAHIIFEDKKDRTGWQIVMLALVKPNYVKSLSFVIPSGLRLLNAFKETKDNLSTRILLIAVILRFEGCCDLISVFFFRLFRWLATIFYGLALIFMLLPVRIDMKSDMVSILWYMDNFPKLYVNGRMPLLLLGAIVYLLDRYLVNKNRKYVAAMAVIFMINSFQGLFCPFYRITYVDVGQGDCALIQTPFSVYGLLIDTGGSAYKDVAGDIVVPFLRSKGIHSVDVIVSHEDTDHMGSLPVIEENCHVNNVYLGKNEVIQFNGLTVISPLYDRYYEEDNDNSQLSYFMISDFGFLFTGDISTAVEEDLLNNYGEMKITVLKVAHHGSRFSSGFKFLSAYRIPFAIISAGRNNSYGHPHSETLERLDSLLINTMCTAEESAIEFLVGPHFLLYRTAKGKTGIYFDER